MTNYNERLDDVLFSLCDLSYASFATQEEADRVADQLDYDRAEAKQAITSLIKELVAEAEPINEQGEIDIDVPAYNDGYYSGANNTLEKFKQNLLKALEEV